ncbi:hypothetical protein [Pseudaestuariivita rosea]|uniref:hypothetical protein n=1 Tax=Pseudaestuariivita rosea TaxID=2763263 RepID=UPI001ABA1359|nr:hypothetical protein [Pseudaestuariivita rosea]
MNIAKNTPEQLVLWHLSWIVLLVLGITVAFFGVCLFAGIYANNTVVTVIGSVGSLVMIGTMVMAGERAVIHFVAADDHVIIDQRRLLSSTKQQIMLTPDTRAVLEPPWAERGSTARIMLTSDSTEPNVPLTSYMFQYQTAFTVSHQINDWLAAYLHAKDQARAWDRDAS